MRTISISASALFAVLLCLARPAIAQDVANGAALWTAKCGPACHNATPSLPQVNAGNAVSILNNAIGTDGGATGMSTFQSTGAGDATNGSDPLSPAQRADLAAYLGSVFSATHSASVAYHASGSVITLPNVALSVSATTSLTSMSTLSSPSAGTLGAYSTVSSGTSLMGSTYNVPGASYTHTANNCTADSFTYRATGPAGNTSTRTLNITITPPVNPTISSSSTAAASWNTSTGITVTVSNAGTSFPQSISITTSTNNGGSVTPVGTTSITYQSNGTNYFATETFSYRVIGPSGCGTQSSIVNMTVNVAMPSPQITSSASASGNGGQAFTHTMTALPANVSTTYALAPASNALPSGLTLSSGGVISGTPTVNGSFPVTVRATNAAGFTDQSLTITLTALQPVITSATTASGNGGQAFSYQITASNVPTSYSITGGTLPSGVTLDTNTGLISGTPTVNGSFPVTVNATNTAGTGSQALTITLTALQPVISSAATASGNGGQAFSYQILASNVPTSYSITGGSLPSGVTLNTSNGLISGTPTVNGVFPVTINATNAGGTGSQALTITLTALQPVITSGATASGNGGQAFSYQIAASNVPTSYSVTGTLPTGVTVNTSSGLVSGTPTQTGTFNVTVNATNTGGTGSQALAITINLVAPTITSTTTAAGNGGQAFSYQIVAGNLPASYSVTGTLPTGVTVNTSTGLISGTPTQGGVFNVTVNAINGAGTGSQALQITISTVSPVVTSSATAAGTGGQPFNYTITADNLPTSFSVTGTLPTGVTLNPSSGVISGTPTQTGTFNVTINATNGAGTGSQALAITINLVAPSVTSATTASGNGGQAFSYTITADNLPTSYSVTGTLPTGVSVNTSNGFISGTPTQTGTFNVTVNATNATGTGSRALAITINLVTPVVTSAGTATGSGGSAFSYTITAGNLPASYSVTGALPAGLSVNTASGAITGTPTVNGTFNVTVNAINGAGTGSQALTITLNPTTPVVTSGAIASGNGGQAFSYQITASNVPTSYSVTGSLPPGVTVNTSSGLISGSPTVNGTFNVTVNATNGAGTGSQALAITLTAVAPAITSAATANGNGGQAFSYQITASNVPTSFSVTGTLPAGLTINTATGVISGTPTVNGTTNVTINATNAAGTGSQSLAIVLTAVTPAITSAGTAPGSGGAPFTYQIAASNVPTSYSVTGALPAGLTLNTSTGLISGTPTVNGTFNVTMGAANAAGTGTAALAIVLSATAPVITSAATASGQAGVPFSYTITANNVPTSFGASNLPAGVTVNASTGVVSGTPSAVGTFPATIEASNGAGLASQALTITISAASLPAPGAVAMTVQLNTPTTLDLAGSITGFQVTGIRIRTAPPIGSATVNGTKVTYTPRTDYFGADSFTYSAFNATGESAPATVSVTVVGRPDPAQQQNVVGTIAAQVQTAQRFAAAQISNFSRRFEALHRFGRGTANPRTQGGDAAVARAPIEDPFVEPAADALTNRRPAAGAAVAATASGTGGASSHGLSTGRGSEVPSFVPAGSTVPAGTPAPLSGGAAFGAPEPLGFDSKPLAQIAAALLPRSGTQTLTDAAPPGALRMNAGGGMGDLINVAAARTLSVAAATGNGAGTVEHASTIGAMDFWVEGSLNFGNRGPAATGGTIDFSTSGLTLGVDWRMTDNLVLGVGVGFARDRTEFGDDGSKSISRGASVAVYGSYTPSQNTFVDAMVGVGTVNVDTDRLVAPLGSYAQSEREGRQVFGSLAAGLELRRSNMLISPYGRVDASYTRLKDSTESGVGAFALHYFGDSSSSIQGALGVRAESSHSTSFGWISPRARIEAIHSFDGDRISQIAYADIIGTRYSIVSSPVERNALVFGVGADFIARGGFALGFDYQLQRSFPEGTAQGIRLRLSQSLDGKSARRTIFSESDSVGDSDEHLSGIRVDAGWMYDDNVTRGRLDAERLRDTNFNIVVSKAYARLLDDNLRLLLIGSAGGERWHSYNGLDRLFAAARAELQYRASADFDAPTLAAFARLTGEQFQSEIRRGYRLSTGVSATQALTDRIVVFGALAHNARFAKNDVFDTRDNSLQINFDYALSSRSTLYAAGEYRRGDVVSSGTGSLANIDIAKVFVADDAFASAQLFAYRTDATTGIFTLGYNLSFGSRDSLDLSWRRARSTPRQRAGPWAAGPWNYEADQFSVVYLVRF